MMNQEDLLKKTGSILKELQEQYQYLAQDPKNLSELELELFLANADFLSDHVQILKKAVAMKSVKELPEHTQVNPLEIQGQQQINVYEDLFKPDLETPTFEFIVHDQLKVKRPEVEAEVEDEDEDEFGFEDEEVIAKQDEQIITEQDEQIVTGQVQPIIFDKDEQIPGSSEPFANGAEQLNEKPDDQIIAEQDEEIIQLSNPISHPITSFDADPIPLEIESEEEVFDETEDRTVIDPEDDEIGPEPFLVAKEPELPTQPIEVAEPLAQPSPAPTPVDMPVSSFSTPASMPSTPVAQPSTPRSQSTAYPPGYQPTLNELLAGKSAVVNTGTPENPKAPISDLKSAITINEKLIFIKDLFDGYNLAYAEVIDLLNKMPDFNTADKFLQSNYAIKYQWSSKQSTADQFYELLHQRFPK
jgi:hypothetical protein